MARKWTALFVTPAVLIGCAKVKDFDNDVLLASSSDSRPQDALTIAAVQTIWSGQAVREDAGYALQGDEQTLCTEAGCLGSAITLDDRTMRLLLQFNCKDPAKLQKEFRLKVLQQACFTDSQGDVLFKATSQSLNSHCPAELGCLTKLVSVRSGGEVSLGAGASAILSDSGFSTASVQITFSTIKPRSWTKATCLKFSDMIVDPDFAMYRETADAVVAKLCQSRVNP
jgi:hypothetical protein